MFVSNHSTRQVRFFNDLNIALEIKYTRIINSSYKSSGTILIVKHLSNSWGVFLVVMNINESTLFSSREARFACKKNYGPFILHLRSV